MKTNSLNHDFKTEKHFKTSHDTVLLKNYRTQNLSGQLSFEFLGVQSAHTIYTVYTVYMCSIAPASRVQVRVAWDSGKSVPSCRYLHVPQVQEHLDMSNFQAVLRYFGSLVFFGLQYRNQFQCSVVFVIKLMLFFYLSKNLTHSLLLNYSFFGRSLLAV